MHILAMFYRLVKIQNCTMKYNVDDSEDGSTKNDVQKVCLISTGSQ